MGNVGFIQSPSIQFSVVNKFIVITQIVSFDMEFFASRPISRFKIDGRLIKQWCADNILI